MFSERIRNILEEYHAENNMLVLSRIHIRTKLIRRRPKDLLNFVVHKGFRKVQPERGYHFLPGELNVIVRQQNSFQEVH